MEFTERCPLRSGSDRLHAYALSWVIRRCAAAPKGGFYQSRGDSGYMWWILPVTTPSKETLSSDGKIPIIMRCWGGLTAGEQVVVSGYENFGNADK